MSEYWPRWSSLSSSSSSTPTQWICLFGEFRISFLFQAFSFRCKKKNWPIVICVGVVVFVWLVSVVVVCLFGARFYTRNTQNIHTQWWHHFSYQKIILDQNSGCETFFLVQCVCVCHTWTAFSFSFRSNKFLGSMNIDIIHTLSFHCYYYYWFGWCFFSRWKFLTV